MKVIWKAAFAAVLLVAATTIEIGCGETYRPVATPSPVTTGNPAGFESEVVLSCCLVPSPDSPNAVTTTPSSVITDVDVSGDSNSGNKVLGNVVATATGNVAGTVVSPMAFDYLRTTVFTANTATDSVTQSGLTTSSAGFSTNTTTISLLPGSKPIGISFEFFGPTYAQDYVVNSGTNATCPNGGSLGAILESTAALKATICVGVTPVYAWIFRDQSKVFVLDQTENQVYVVSASKYMVTNKIPVGAAPIKAAQSADGNYVYTVNSGDGTISIINGLTETVVGTAMPSSNAACGAICSSPVVDIAQDPNYNDTSANSQYNHIWFLHKNGTVSVYDATVPGTLSWITSLTTGANPTNLALMRDGTMAYVGLGGTDQIVAINTSLLAVGGAVTANATTTITVGVHRTLTGTMTDSNGTVFNISETTTPTVNYVAVSRGGNSSDLSKAYASTITNTVYAYFDANMNPTISRPASDPTPTPIQGQTAWCSDSGNTTTCANLYNGTSVVAAAADGTAPINSYVTTIPAPNQVTYCTFATGLVDGQKSCPLMTPQMVVGRS
jgi:YVTN family beta-propeller protein